MKNLYQYLVLFLIFSSCQSSTETVFKQVSSDNSGIDFQNTLKENDSINYFTYAYMYMGGGVAVGDLDNDGLDDLFFTGNMVENKLYLNKGNLKFEDISSKAGVSGSDKWYTGVTMADINADGFLDIYCSVAGKFGNKSNELYINNGDLTFTEQAETYGLADDANSVQASFFDFDKDGDLDVYIANYPITPFNAPNQLYAFKQKYGKPHERDRLMENRDGVFVDITEAAGVLNFGLSLSVTIGDVNNDSWPDIYISNDFSTPDFFYINQGDGTFKNQVKNTTGQTAFYGMGVDIADFNNDQLLDIVQVDMMAKDNRRAKANMASMNPSLFWGAVNSGFHYQYMHNMLQMNNGNLNGDLPSFSNSSKFAGISSTDWSWGPLFADLNNDGLKDLFISNGTRREINNRDYFNSVDKNIDEGGSSLEKSLAIPSEPIDNFVYENPGSFPFILANEKWGISFKGFSNGCIYADLDNDGDLEIITNNIDDKISFFENTSSESTNYLSLKFRGLDKNLNGLGVRVYVNANDQNQMQELTLSRGFQSSVSPRMHFGLGNSETIQELKIQWPSGKSEVLTDIASNQEILILEKNATELTLAKNTREEPKLFEILKDSTVLQSPFYEENYYDDYTTQVLLPHNLSQFGPAMAKIDFDNDGLMDFVLGGAHGYPAQIMQQTPKGFQSLQVESFEKDKIYEDAGIIALDANSDGLMDLYFSSGGNEFEINNPLYQDRLYLNKGDGIFEKSLESLPQLNYSSGKVYTLDFDLDGDLDLLVSSRLVPDNYPSPASSTLLENISSDTDVKFIDVTKDKAPDLLNIGLVTSVSIMDINEDKKPDMLLVGEWMPLTLLINSGKDFKNKSDQYGLKSNSRAWWWSIKSGDFDADGDIDFLVGNNGLNYKYKASKKETFDVFVSDFDNNTKDDIVLSYYNNGEQFPVRGRECSSQQIPTIKQKFKNYESFSTATLVDVYSEKELDEALHYQIESFASIYLENKNGILIAHELPQEAQMSNINQILTGDYDKDGHLDALIAGNLYQSEVETPRNDAGIGLFLKGDGKGNFKSIPARKSGFYAPGDVKDMIELDFKGSPMIIVGKNQDYLQYIKAQ